MARERLHIVVSCTDRKRGPVAARLRLRSISGHSIPERAAQWWERLQSTHDGYAPARSVYAGELWTANQALVYVAEAAGFTPTLWVASAGYGLLDSSTPIVPYSATFVAGSPDSVARPSSDATGEAQNRAWWATLGNCTLDGQPRTLTTVARKEPRSRFIVVGSPTYVGALAEDLAEVRSTLRDPDGLIIVTSRLTAESNDLHPHLIASSARFLSRVGGTRVALHARVAAVVLENASQLGLSAATLRKRHARSAAQYAPPPKLERKRMTDEEVLRFIRARRITSYSAGVRELRSSGLACEQKRFRNLFKSLGGTL